MAICQVCDKSKQYGHNVSHSKRRTKRVFLPNIFRKRMLLAKGRVNEKGEIKRIKICGKCIKRAKKFGEVKAAKGAKLEGAVIKAVDWIEKVKIKEKKIKTETEKVRKIKEDKAAEKKKPEVSIEELVGKR